MAKITDRQARAIKPGSKPIAAGITGLALLPTTTAGRGSWRLRFVSPVTGKRRDMGLGTYPDVPVADALALAQEAREHLAAGRDPIQERDKLDTVPTFEQAARERWQQVAPGFRNAKHRAQWISSLEQHVLPAIGSVRVDKLTPQDFADALRPSWLAVPDTASRVKQRCTDVMAACWAKGLTTGNPLDVVDRLLPKQPPRTRHQPAMPWRMVPEFVAEQLNRRNGARAALLFLILTAARSGEVRGATWAEIDMDAALWTVPAERMKAHRPHRVPLSSDAMALLRSLRGNEAPSGSALVFTAVRGGQLSDMALSSLLRRAQAPSDIDGRTATAHGFRSSFRNWAADHGYGSDVAERALAHKIGNKVQAAYERTDRLEARIHMMQQWAEHVMGRTASNVVPIRGAA